MNLSDYSYINLDTKKCVLAYILLHSKSKVHGIFNTTVFETFPSIGENIVMKYKTWNSKNLDNTRLIRYMYHLQSEREKEREKEREQQRERGVYLSTDGALEPEL